MPVKDDFIEPAVHMAIKESRIEKITTPFLEKQAKVDELVSRLFLDKKTKRTYLLHYNTRRNYLIKE